MYYDILHFSIVNRALGSCAPGFFSTAIIREHTYNINFVQIFEFQGHRIFDPPTHHEMQFAHALNLSNLGSCR